MHEPGELSADAAAQFDRLTAHLNADIQGQLTLVAFNGAGSIDTYRPDLVVDAALGIGITAEVRAPISHLIKATNKLEVPVVSVDVPTGRGRSEAHTSELQSRWPHVYTLTLPLHDALPISQTSRGS